MNINEQPCKIIILTINILLLATHHLKPNI